MNVESATNIETVRFVIFSLEDKKYCLPATLMKEIIIKPEIYYIPFCPKYVKGIINRHGEPFTVIDLRVLFENQEQEEKKIVILNYPDNEVAILITDVLEVIEVGKENMVELSSKTFTEEFFVNFFSHKGENVFQINMPRVLQRLENDL
jgi:chemotaxis signal transduction protein